jgi:hypothetical protein
MYGKIKSQLGKKESKEGDSGKGKDLAEGPKSAKEAFLSLGNIGSQALMSIIGGSKELTEKFDGISGKLNGALSGALSKIQEEALKAFGPFIEDALNLAEEILPYVINILDWVVSKIGAFFQFLQDHQVLAYMLGGAIMAIAIAAWALTTATTVCSVAMGILNVVTSMGPWGIVILLVGALAGAFLYLSSKVGGVGNAFKLLGDIAMKILSNVSNLFTSAFGPIIEAIKYLSEGEWSKALSAFKSSDIIGAFKKWQADGGILNGVQDIKDKAFAKGEAEKKEKKEKEEKKKGELGTGLKNQTVNSSNSASPNATSGGSGTNITIRIENLVKELIIQSVDGGIPVTAITKQISHALIAAVNDSQITV